MSTDDFIQSRVEQLGAITARRNELLREMYHLIRHRDNVGSILQPGEFTEDDEDTKCNEFLSKFDLNKHGEQGFIAKYISSLPELYLEDSPPPSSSDGTVPGPSQLSNVDHNRPMQGQSSSQAPRTKSTAIEQMKGSLNKAILSKAHTMRDAHKTEEETDEDRDELDLLGGTGDTDSATSSSPKPPANHAPQPPSSQEPPPQPTVAPEEVAPASSSSHTVDKVEGLASNDAENGLEKPLEDTAMGEDPVLTEAIEGENANIPNPTNSSNVAPDPAMETLQHSISSTTITESTPMKIIPQAVHKPSGSSTLPMPVPKSSIVIPTPLLPSISMDRYNVEQPPEPQMAQIQPTPTPRYSIKADYTLPPLQLLPPEFNRKKSTKRRKDRDRPEKSQKDDGLPIGINRWAAMLSANPIYKRVSRSTKCLSTKEWSIAIAELRLIRTIERIEVMKSQARWGLRQVKKQRAIGGLVKTHWDYLLDEMKWMRIDFREERKWKLALAYQISTSVLEWHALGSWEERVEKGVCVKWKTQGQDHSDERGSSRTMDVDSESEAEMDSSLPPSNSLLGLDYTSDNDDMDGEDKKLDVVDPLETTATINGAMDGVEELRQQAAESEAMTFTSDTVKPKTEDVDEHVSLQPPATLGGTQSEVIDKGLKSSSNDPLLGSKSSSHSLNGDTEEKPPNVKAKIGAYAPLREQVVYGFSDKLFIGPEDLEPPQMEGQSDKEFEELDLSTLFPDLQPLAMFDVAPAVTEGKKKSSRTERDDPNKRTEETNYTKVYPIGKFMHSKPTLLGPLQPSKRWKNGKWLPVEETPITPESEAFGYIKPLEESVSDLFDLKAKPSGPALPPQPRDARRVKVDQYWSPNDDFLLKTLVDKYPGNWNLIAECFNGCRKTTPADRRTANDCMDRWKAKWGMDLLTKGDSQVNSEDQTPPIGLQASSSNLSDVVMSNSASNGPSVTTRGIKRLASSSVSSQVAPSLAAGSEPKKRRRHLLLQESIRKTARKRQDQQAKQQANQRKTPGMHETHIQFTKLPKLTPAELSRMKAERDAAQMAEMQKARARQEEMKNQQRQLNGIPIPAQAAQGQAQQAPSQQPGQPQQLSSQQVAQQLQLLHQQAQVQAAQAQANQANRAANPPRPGSVNIARLSTPTGVGVAGTSRITSQQMLQLQQAQRIAAAGVNQQAALNGNPGAGMVGVAMNGQVVAPQFGNRDATASPATRTVNSPHLAAASGSVASNPPRSPHDAAAAASQVAPAAGASVATNGSAARPQNHFLSFNPNGANLSGTQNLNPEQLNALRIQMLSQLTQFQQQGVQQAPQPQGQ